MEHTAFQFGVPMALLAAVREQEGGSVGDWHRNPDGSFDYGVMQVNSRWLPRLVSLGYSATVLTYDDCASIAAGGWILANELAEAGVWRNEVAGPAAYWRAVGRYHSRTPTLNRRYAEAIWVRYLRLARIGVVPITETEEHGACAPTPKGKAGDAGLAVSTVDAGVAGEGGATAGAGSTGKNATRSRLPAKAR